MTQTESATVTVLTPQQAADRLGCSKPHVYRLISSGVLESVDISAPGSMRTKTRILVSDLESYILNQRRG